MGFSVIYHFVLGMGASTASDLPATSICVSNLTIVPAISAHVVIAPNIQCHELTIMPAIQILNVSITPPCGCHC